MPENEATVNEDQSHRGSTRWVEVLAAPNQIAAEVAIELLQREGIPARIEPADSTGFLGGALSPLTTRVLVPEDKEEEALGWLGPQPDEPPPGQLLVVVDSDDVSLVAVAVSLQFFQAIQYGQRFLNADPLAELVDCVRQFAFGIGFRFARLALV